MAENGFTDGYLYPGSFVLANKGGHRDQADLDRFEANHTAVRLQEVRTNPVNGDFDLAHLQALHRTIFRDVYAWAGEVRTVDILKGPKGDRTLFSSAGDIEKEARGIHAQIQDANYLRGMDKSQFTAKIAEVFADLNSMHPFREGNGRTSREYLNQLAKGAGYELDLSKVDRTQWLDASKASHQRGDLKPIREVFGLAATPMRAVAFRNLPEPVALAKHPELDAAYMRLIEVRRSFSKDTSPSAQKAALVSARASIASTLDQGRLPSASISVDDSRRVIDHAAKYRNLMVRDAAALERNYRGEVVAMSSHHVLLKVSDSLAVRYEKGSLDKSVQVGEKLAIQYSKDGNQVKTPQQARETGRDRQLEREISGRR